MSVAQALDDPPGACPAGVSSRQGQGLPSSRLAPPVLALCFVVVVIEAELATQGGLQVVVRRWLVVGSFLHVREVRAKGTGRALHRFARLRGGSLGARAACARRMIAAACEHGLIRGDGPAQHGRLGPNEGIALG